MSREWIWALTEEFFKPERHLFVSHSKGYYYLIDKVLPQSSRLRLLSFSVLFQNSKRDHRHLSFFYFVGLILGLAIYHSKLFFGHFGISFYKVFYFPYPSLIPRLNSVLVSIGSPYHS